MREESCGVKKKKTQSNNRIPSWDCLALSLCCCCLCVLWCFSQLAAPAPPALSDAGPPEADPKPDPPLAEPDPEPADAYDSTDDAEPVE